MSALDAARKRVAGDWMLYILMAALSQSLPRVMVVSGWFPGADRVMGVALIAGLVGLLMAYTRLSAGAASLSMIVLSLAHSIEFAGDVLPPWPMVASDLARVARWLREAGFMHLDTMDLPLSYGLTYLFERGSVVWARASHWVLAYQTGATNTDNTFLELAVCWATWVLHWNLGFQLFRSRRALAGLVPLGIAVLAAVSFTNLGTRYAQVYLVLALVTWLFSSAGRMQMLWNRWGVLIAPRLRQHMLFTGFPLAGLVLVFALSMPYASYDRAVYYFWERAGHRLRAFYEQLDRAFAGRNPVPKPTLNPDASGGDPGIEEHDIRKGTSTSDRTVFPVKTSDPVTSAQGRDMPKRYWRERTYDRYTGHGWASSESRTAVFARDAAWKEVTYPRSVLTQTFTLLRGAGLGFAVNEPVAVNQKYSIVTRGAGDLTAFSIDLPYYTVVSMVPSATAQMLQVAQDSYPDWVRQRYLALPAIPDRVRQLSLQIVAEAGAQTRYGKARAIEAYLRTFVYDENLAPPAWDADVVEYYLFQARRGYCDYSATAMVVMLRSVGVAARYASGYGTGAYDERLGGWVVVGKNAHAWVEVYFPGYGWIEFEPTPAQTVFVRGETISPLSPTPTPLDVPTPDLAASDPSFQDDPADFAGLEGLWKGRSPRLAGLARWSLALALLGIIVWSPRLLRRRGLHPQRAVWRAYSRVLGRARLLGVVPYEHLTPGESLQQLVREVALRQGWEGAIGVAQDVAVLQRLYERARYSDAEISVEEGRQAEDAWERLREPLTRLLWMRRRNATD